ncbi:uncharacterized protein LOC118195353 [Stegodyphus dumicola]|uniref:uncharacterized protein LOC118195353 n=1 Tax=Stegodyphus dumicola TaxID=202533 RepID=UPI0015AB4CEB|nr:uncharacterized protein LOC118195353 [Stegodyphus dumicola]
MNGFIFFILCAVTGSLASPTCSGDVDRECGSLGDKDWRGRTWPENAKELDKACRNVQVVLDCQIAYVQRCPDSFLALFEDYMKESKKLYGKLCFKLSSFRGQFLKHVTCLNNVTIELYNSCKKSVPALKPSQFCAYNTKVLDCVKSNLEKSCGEEALQVFNGLYQPIVSLDKIFCKKSAERSRKKDLPMPFQNEM